MNNFTIYLSSTKYHWWNFKSYMWKHRIVKELSMLPLVPYYINFIDPLNYESEDPIVCPMDIRDINKSDYVICYIDKITIGTIMELSYCLWNGMKRKLYVLSFNKNVVNHPWIKYNCKGRICYNYTDCCLAIYKDMLKRIQKDGNTTNTRTI